ncbi:MAG: TlpA disulfide reductase family protein [Armatimonadota bacterium]
MKKSLTLIALLLVLSLALTALSLSGCQKPAQQTVVKPPPPLLPEAQKTATSTPKPAESGENVAKPAPSFTATDIDGQTHSLGDYGGKILVIDFWATYCKPCVKKLREYESLYQMYKGRNVNFIALSMDESDEVIKGWRQQNDVNFPLARLTDQAKSAFFGDAALVPIPQMRIVDRKRVIRYSFGPDSTTDDVEAALKTLLAEKR